MMANGTDPRREAMRRLHGLATPTFTGDPADAMRRRRGWTTPGRRRIWSPRWNA